MTKHECGDKTIMNSRLWGGHSKRSGRISRNAVNCFATRFLEFAWNDGTFSRLLGFVACFALVTQSITADPPLDAKDILNSVRMLESRQQIDLQGQLRQDDVVIPFRLVQNG